MLAMMIAASTANGQLSQSSYSYAPSSSSYQFTRSGVPYHLQLCATEVCKVENGATLVIENTIGGVNGVLQEVAGNPDDTYLIFYPSGKQGDENARQILRKKFLIKLKPDVSMADVKKRCSIPSMNMKYPSKGLVVCEASSALEVLDLVDAARGDVGVEFAEPLFARKRFKRKIPADPLFPPTGGQDGVYQWGFLSDGDFDGDSTQNVRTNITKSWDLLAGGSPATGVGVRVAVVDDGILTSHQDLNIDLATSVDVFDGDTDVTPDPADPTATHGTEVAGLIGAIWDNDEGIAGVAPNATVFGVRLLGGEFIDDEQEAAAFEVGQGGSLLESTEVSNNSWGPSDFSTELGPIGPLALAAIESSTQTQRLSESGTVFVWAGGNGGEISDNSNYDAYAALPETIAVGAVTDQGTRASYSERGANLVVSAPSGGGQIGIVTTSFDETQTPNYTTNFGGTSAAAPIVSGVAAQMIQAKKWLNWREVQEILISTATRINPEHPDWYENAAGFWFNHDYGAGLINAEAAVQAVLDLPPGPPIFSPLLPDRGEPLVKGELILEAIPDAEENSYLYTIDMSDQANRRVEHVQLATTIISQRRADLDIVLISPSGTQSILAQAHGNSDEQSISNWNFMTVRNWGEGSAGKWYLRVTDRIPGNQSTLNNVSLIIHGPEDASAPVIERPVLISDRVINAVEGRSFTYYLETLGSDTIQVNNLPTGLVFDPDSLSIAGIPAEGGLTSTELILTGPAGTGVSNLSFVVRPTTFSLGSGVEQDERPNTALGDVPWIFEETETAGGVDAVGTPFDLGDNLEARFGFSSVPASVAYFKWRLDSFRPKEDMLWLVLEQGVLPYSWSAFIDGTKDWTQVGVSLPESTNSIEWVYRRGGPVADGEVEVDSGRAFLDEVEFVSFDTYQKSIEAAGNFAADFEYISESRTLWLPVTDTEASDQLALMTSGVGHGQQVSIAAWVDGAASVSFDYKTSISDTGDVFEYLVNGVVRNSASGDSGGYTNITDTLPPGRNYVQIRYRKDSTATSGADAVWLDNLVISTQSASAVWAGSYGLDNAAMGEDSDNDGYTNFEEYAFGGNPNLHDTPQYTPTYHTDGLNRWIEYGVNSLNTNLQYVAQESTDLETWSASAFSAYDRTEGNVRYYRIPIFAEDPSRVKRFYRVHVTTR